MNGFKNKFSLFLFLTALLVGVDQLSKLAMVALLASKPLVIVPHFFQLYLTYNTGAAFSILPNGRLFFLMLTPIVLYFAYRYYLRYYLYNQWLYFGGIFFFAGALGNFIDRLFFGKVVDFFSFTFGGYDFAIFNVADVFLNISFVLLLIGFFLYEKENKVG